ncbi:Septation initiation network scaffold protein cdc11 [Penicillium ucsense]|uniref:Septation initiation network scaffold protein cdc11 n=1 Tax=Penicillium ucsense TaxID=2839758 RepID=A0A8J8W612_9EURO|nr:Septation initiation network scaffold protein cdc11 [Penicillium ucsense]KAF7735506.1 Septation initiation network scaffold protein cdc11 [Penicillium ucsense]
MGDEPWLDSLSDDWPSAPATPTPEGPAVSLLASSPRRPLDSPSRIPVAARRSVAQQPSPVDHSKKVTRPCHFIRREPPKPKFPRTPTIRPPPKPVSTTPTRSRRDTPKASPKPSPRPAQKNSPKTTPKGSPRPSLGTFGRQPSNMDTRSPLRSVSNVSSYSATQLSPQGTDTVQIKPIKGQKDGGDTPEWRKRLVRGELAAADQRDLFAPMGLESVFKPPSPSSVSGPPDSMPFTKPDEQLWEFTEVTSRRGSAPVGDEKNKSETETANEDESLAGTQSQSGTVCHQLEENSPIGSPSDAQFILEEASQTDGMGVRTASGLEDLRNEGITPITFTRPETLSGGAASEVIKSALKQVTNKLESLSLDSAERPDSPASDSFLLHNNREPQLDHESRDDSLLDATSHSLPQDLSMGTVDFNRRVASRAFHQRFSPSPFPSHRKAPNGLANTKIRTSSIFGRSPTNVSPVLPRPSSSHVRPSTSGSGDADSKDGTMPSSGSPLKLFGEYDTFTNNRLMRRMSQFEGAFGDGSEGDDPPSPSEEARRKGESRSFLNSRHEPLPEIPSRLNERLASRNANRPRINRFGDGELDKFDFSDASPYENKLVYDEIQGFGSRPVSRKRSSDRQQYLRWSSQRHDSLRYARSASSGFTRKPSAWTRQSYFGHQRTRVMSRKIEKENIGVSETKRVPRAAPADPRPKRRRTILRDDSAGPEASFAQDDSPSRLGESLSLLQRSLIQHGVQPDNGDFLAPPGLSQSTQRPRTPTPSQIRSSHQSRIAPSGAYSEVNFDERDYSDSFSLEGEIPLVKITGTSDSSRKGSITTQDYLNEATKIMDLIRSKGRPTVGLTSVQESNPESEEEEEANSLYEDESTREAFSRPPSREGIDLRKQREPKELNPQILSYLKMYQEREEMDFGATGSTVALSTQGRPRADPQGTRGSGLEPRKRKPSGSIYDMAENIAHDLMTINTQMSGFSVRSVPTGSSQNSTAKGMLSSDLVSHLIPEQVNGFVYDRSKHQWVKDDPHASERKTITHEDLEDPFKDIPDLSVDEIQEMMRIQNLGSRRRSQESEDPPTSASQPAEATRPPAGLDEQEAVTHESVHASSVPSRSTPLANNPPNTGSRTTSWGAHNAFETNHASYLATGNDALAFAPEQEPKKSRVATITFSSPVVSHVAYQDDSHGSDTSSRNTESGAESSMSREEKAGAAYSVKLRDASSQSQPFIRRPISRIDERNEDTANDLSLVRMNNALKSPTDAKVNSTEQSLVPLTSPGQENSYSFHLSPLADFSVNQPDRPLNSEISYVAQRDNPTSLRQVHGTFALATEDLIKHITDAEPYEPYWEHVRRLVLRQKGLTSLQKLSQFCPRLEDLDVTENSIGQLSGVPPSLRTLKISKNCLSNLTAWSHLTNLQYLDISGNDIQTLNGFSSLIHLRELKATDNKIRNIDGVLELNGLLSLKLNNNLLKSVNFKGTELTRLRDLDLSHNRLESVHHIEWLPALTNLDLSANRLQCLDAATALISLRALKLSENRLERFDMQSFFSVHLLYLDQNNLSSVAGLEHCHNLEVLSVREQTPAPSQDDSILNLDLGLVKDVRKVFLASNKLSETCLRPSTPLLRLQLLDVAACAVKALPAEFSATFPNLKVLNLNFNSLADLEPLVGMKCLSRLTVAGNRLNRMRRVCQILSRLGRTSKSTPCSLRKLDIRGNPLTVGFYPPTVTGNGSKADRKKTKDPASVAISATAGHRELTDALADLDGEGPVDNIVTWDDSSQSGEDMDVNDPFTLPAADPQADEKYLLRLDRATRMRRKVLELLLYAGTNGSLCSLDGLNMKSLLVENADMSQAWSKLEELGVLRRKAITGGKGSKS